MSSVEPNCAIVENIERRLRKELGRKPAHIEGLRRSDWVLMDYIDFVVHVFLAERREFYRLESLWGDATIAHRVTGRPWRLRVPGAASAIGRLSWQLTGVAEITSDETGVRTAAGVLAGSALELDRAVRNLVEFTGCDLADEKRLLEPAVLRECSNACERWMPTKTARSQQPRRAVPWQRCLTASTVIATNQGSVLLNISSGSPSSAVCLPRLA